ncbi:carbohydrate ABC transporter permease [Caproicibacterium amylolyticum]|uniref:Carbohydrate ABC transporter permease n=1 Tax=Caproicibacterium amylolyticum TaxID=2766537 RepID=A0A7G9WIF9_9FIRM|nr:carbohydrate ABC transporter permease [Caproicibacterium amylolyticum]MBE6721181.1 carbohydrate ABC transporter permease [Oscillospiraceae bacterium]QNO18471.1 carbohydrate ABC transporter permease [Caproicibacterium amylolyticum]
MPEDILKNEKGTKAIKVKKTRGDIIFDIVVYGLAAIVMLIILYPLYFIVIASFSDPSQVANGNVWLYPKGFTLDGYKELLKQQDIWTGYGNTVLYTVVGTVIGLAVNIPAAYALSRKDLYGKKVLTFLFLFTMFFNGGLVPTYLTVQQFHLYNTFWVMVLPFSVSVYNIIVARTFFQSSIPADLWDAAQIDGCGNLRYFAQIVLPLSKAILAVLGLWIAVGIWNSYFNALIYLKDTSLYPLQLVLRNILVTNQMQSALGTGEAAQVALRMANLLRYSAIIVSTVPIMCVYPFVQKYFNQGVMIGAVKG